MEDQDLKKLWKAYDQKLDKILDLNLKNFESTQVQKSKSALYKLLAERIASFLFALIVDIVIGKLLGNNLDSPSIVVSAVTVMVFMIVTMMNSVYQIYLIVTFDHTQSIAQNQRVLAKLEAFMLFFLRLVIMMVPFYIAYMLVFFKLLFGINLWQIGTVFYWNIQIALSLVLVPVAIWVAAKISSKNLHIRWVKWLVATTGHLRVMEALKYMREIEDFKREE